MPPRVRLAPSPTGYFHVGTARTALFNWLFARRHGGTFVLRIEDTDKARNQPEQIAGIQRALRWLGLDWDEGPLLQSEHHARHRLEVQRLLDTGHAYACDCTPEAVAERAKARGGPPGYDGFCRDRGLEPTVGRVVRFRTPDEGRTVFTDLIRGEVAVDNAAMVDFVVRKSDGDPLFLLANPVDDFDMSISHVIRGEDHVSNTSRYVLLWEALGYGSVPTFAHTPLILNQARKKLSKRRDKVAVEDYRDDGYLPEAFCNYLALLGWSPGGDREILGLDEMVQEFRLEDVKSAPAVFDERKLRDVNAQYLRALGPDELQSRSLSWLSHRVRPVLPLVQERARTLAEVWAMTDFLYLPDPNVDVEAWDKAVAKQPAFGAILSGAESRFATCEWDAAGIRQATVDAGVEAGVTQLGRAQEPVRLAVTGRTVGPPLFEALQVLGRDRSLARVKAGLARLEASTPAD
ncbi:MAG TPA: glutamate--tRNA ligase [Acidimicrobiales bacterium]|nr:glutamate--tRNA ligase [Acidimicrobiales bacterium]